ncbi:hypothetical protein TWF730_005693 [Orbilia blumenaviensis]|uniref:AB hydrolase-1 domain-containing protein n=1 Tax=Orbilia blumenaviensis TaxID=1796055 RepID=A0AAV9VLG2_9PEZI
MRALYRPISRTIQTSGITIQRCLYSTHHHHHHHHHPHPHSSKADFKMSYSLHHPHSNYKHGSEKHEPIIFMHGLFGSKMNNRGISKMFVKELGRSIFALDLRNHGESPHITPHTYTAMAEDVEHFIKDHKLENPTLIGHSMGAKVAMAVALRSPDLIQDIIAVDNAPVNAQLGRQFGQYLQAMSRIEATPIVNTKEADEILAAYEPSLPIRQFLFTNLLKPTKSDDRFRWRIPIKILGNALDEMAAFPFTPGEKVFTKPALFVRGTTSKYVADETIPLIGEFFPRFQLKDVEAGHWLISENPEEFKNVCLEFFRREKEE